MIYKDKFEITINGEEYKEDFKITFTLEEAKKIYLDNLAQDVVITYSPIMIEDMYSVEEMHDMSEGE